MADAILAAVVGLGLGALAAGALALARHSAGAWQGPALLTAVLAAAVAAGVFLGDWFRLTVATTAGESSVTAGIGSGVWFLIAVAVATAAGGGVFWRRDRGASTPEAVNPARPLSPRELWRPKEAGDCWVLVTGAPRSGKTALIARMVEAASAYVQLAAPVRHGEGDGLCATELSAQGADGSARRLRFWKHTRETDLPGRPAAGDLDGVVHVIDATRVRGTADSFPPAVRAGDAIDADEGTLALAAWLPKGRPVWLAITKADLLRLSIAPKLVGRLEVGPGWREQLRNLAPVQRAELARSIGAAEHGGDTVHDGGAPFERGQGTPFLVYAGRGDAGDGAFGGAGLVGAIVDTLARDMKEHTIG